MNLYVHIPFCNGPKCDYCAFYSVTATAARRAGYADLLLRELTLRLPKGAPVKTLYFGGGTPTCLSGRSLKRLVHGLRSYCTFRDGLEFTVESTPQSLTPPKAKLLASTGVTRISMGVQSFDPDALGRIGRDARSEQPAHAVANARQAGIDNIGLDLIAALPGFTDQRWKETLTKALTLKPNHVSVYALSVESGTPLERAIRNDARQQPDEDVQLRAIATARQMLDSAGLERYEISNYARPGWRCRHNLDIWYGSDYIGIGPAASTRNGRQRRTNHANLDAWNASLTTHRLPPAETERLTEKADAIQRTVFQLRCRNGLNLKRACERFPVLKPLQKGWESILIHLRRHALTEKHNHTWTLTRKGMNVADAIIAELL